MNARLLLIALGCGAADAKLLPLRNTGSSKVLTLRGGNTGQLINAMAALNAVSGLQGWAYPEETLKMYGVKAGVTESESFIMRCVGGVQLASAVRANVTPSRPRPHCETLSPSMLQVALMVGKADIDKAMIAAVLPRDRVPRQHPHHRAPEGG